MQQQLVQAIHTLYHNADPQVKKQTESQLEAWQQSESAWSLSDTILHDSSSTMEAQYFCAQTLRTKVTAPTAHCLRQAFSKRLTEVVSVLPGAKRLRGAACTSSRCFAHLPAGLANSFCHWRNSCEDTSVPSHCRHGCTHSIRAVEPRWCCDVAC